MEGKYINIKGSSWIISGKKLHATCKGTTAGDQQKINVLISVRPLVIEFIDRNQSSLRETNSSSFDMPGQKKKSASNGCKVAAMTVGQSFKYGRCSRISNAEASHVYSTQKTDTNQPLLSNGLPNVA